jgi:hypothetical protein
MKAPPEERSPCAGGRVSVMSEEVMAGTTRKRQPRDEEEEGS